MILSSGPACAGASLASAVKYAAAALNNWPPFASSAPRLSLSFAGILGRLLLILFRSVQKLPVSLGMAKPGTEDALLAGDEPPAGAALLVLPAAAVPPAEPPPQPPSIRQAPATAATMAPTRGVDLMASMSCPSW